MKRIIIALVMCLLLFTSIGFTADEKSEDIIGYGEYVFESSASDFDLSDFDKDTGDTYGIAMVAYGRDDYEFSITAGTTTTSLLLAFEEDSLASVMVIFENLLRDIGDIDDVKWFVRSLRNVVLDNYEDDLVVWDEFGFEYDTNNNYLEGFLQLEDEDGDVIALMWDGYDLNLGYVTADMWDIINEGINAKAKEGESKL